MVSSKTCELNSGHLILYLPRGRDDDRRLSSQSSSSRIRHHTKVAKPRGCRPENTQHVTDAYTENCVVHIKIAVLAIVAFAIAGRKTIYSSIATGY